MLGHLGTQQLGAVSLANLAVSFAIYTFSFLVFLTTPRIAAAHVAGDKDAVSRLAGVGLWLAGGCGLVTTLGVMLLAGPIVTGAPTAAAVVQAAVVQPACQQALAVVAQQRPAGRKQQHLSWKCKRGLFTCQVCLAHCFL
jgi:O-antigen/teichoic acid export membrane protein